MTLPIVIVKRLFAGIAVVQAGAMVLPLKAIDLLRLAAVRAERTIGPAELFEVLAGFIFVVEDRVCQVDFGHGFTSLLRRI